jgi:Fe2+ or Zn2+ uptake regulation protein
VVATSCDSEGFRCRFRNRNAGTIAGAFCRAGNPHDPGARDFERHRNCEQTSGASKILRKAQKIDASVDRSTVYRTLQLLKRQGLIDELDLMHIDGDGHYYERKQDRDHIHMACLRCGKIAELVSDSFEKLKQQVEKDCRFRVLVSRSEIARILFGLPGIAVGATISDSIGPGR